MKPGLYPNVPFAEYLHWPVLSQSVLKEGRASMAHVRAAMDRERVKIPTDAMMLGSALHTCFLEPEQFGERVKVWTGDTRRGKEWDAFREEHAEKVILTLEKSQRLLGMVDRLRRHPFVREWSRKIEHVEISVVGEVEGVQMKGRCDALTPEPLVDLKKVRSADPASVTKTVLTFGYAIQAAIYRLLYGRDRFVLVCVEDEPPYDCVAYELSPAFLRYGLGEANGLLERYREAVATGVWSGRSDKVVTLEIPGWLAEKQPSEVTIGGAAVFGDDDDESHPF